MPITRYPKAFAAICVTRCPKPPPAPDTTTQSPGLAHTLRKAAYEVSPAHSIGAATSELTPSGIGVRYRAGTVRYCWNVPGLNMPDTDCLAQRPSSPAM